MVDVDADGFIDSLSGHLAKFKQPKAVAFVGKLPRNTMGIVQKKTLREIYANEFK